MATDYLPILLLFAIGILLAIVMVGASWLFGPKKKTPFKETPYECGVEPVGDARERFPVKFFLVAILFIIFDIESIFLYPWFVTLKWADKAFQVFTLVEVGVFFALLVVGYLYVIRRNAIDFDEGSAVETLPGTETVPVRGEEVA
ncbi:MAG: NADH-quinone oxidoreductase subunit A [Fimbriimonadales bacterium]